MVCGHIRGAHANKEALQSDSELYILYYKYIYQVCRERNRRCVRLVRTTLHYCMDQLLIPQIGKAHSRNAKKPQPSSLLHGCVALRRPLLCVVQVCFVSSTPPFTNILCIPDPFQIHVKINISCSC